MSKKNYRSAKLKARIRRRARARAVIRRLRCPRLAVRRSARHMHVQLIMPQEAGQTPSDRVIVSASTEEPVLKTSLAQTGNIAGAKAVGKLLGERAREKGIEKIAFDRSGYRYHGRVAAVAEGAREAGLVF